MLGLREIVCHKDWEWCSKIFRTDVTSITEERPKNSLWASDILDLADQALESSKKLVNESDINYDEDLSNTKILSVNKYLNPNNSSSQSFVERNI